MSDNRLEIQVEHSLQTANGKLPMEVSLSLLNGKILALTGPSGAGKTTLLKQIAGLVIPHAGRISFGDQVWLDTNKTFKIPPQQRNIGFVFQDYALFPHMTVRENLEYALPQNGDSAHIDQLLTDTGLTQLADRKPFQLSGGQQQRVALVRALVRKPDLLLLDEPFNALDHSMRHQLQDLLLKFQRQSQLSVIVVTHNIGEIFKLADQVAIMENGKIIKSGTPSEVYLTEKEESDHFVVLAEVLEVLKLDNLLIVKALIENKIRQLQMPLEMHDQLEPGKSFVIQYSLNAPTVHLIHNS